MALQGTLMEALLTWVNSLKVSEPIECLSQMQDLNVLIKIVSKLNGSSEETPPILKKPLEDRLTFLQRHCRCGSKAENLVQWQKILQGENSEVEICKVIVLVFYVSNMKSKNVQEWESFDHKTQTELASILRFVLDNEDDLSLGDKLMQFLHRKGRDLSSSDSSPSCDETTSPNVFARKTQVRFLELHRVASSSTMKSLGPESPSSPMNEVLHMPQFQIRRLRKQLAEGRDLRDDLELELAEIRKRLAEKDAQIFLMQQRIERLVVLNEKQAEQQEPKELEELREKNESLMIRLRDALKQCQDLKTDRNQLERKNDQLSEENGDLSYKVRDLSSRLLQLQTALNETIEEHELSVAGWKQQQSQLEKDLNAMVTEKKCLEERNQILQGKISMLEDQLKMLGESESHQKGERMGDILQLEQLKQEVVALNTKSVELQAQIAQMVEEKNATEASFESQRSRFESEKIQLQDIVTNLQTSLSEITFQKEKQDQEARLQEEKLTCQITTLKLEISKLKASLAQKDDRLSGLHREVEEEKKLKGELVEKLRRQEESSKQSIAELHRQIDQLDHSLKLTEGKLLEATEKLSSNAKQMVNLQQERDNLISERDSALTMFSEYKNTREEELRTLSKSLQTLEKDHRADLAAIEDLKLGKAELMQKIQERDATVLDLIAKCQTLDVENDTRSKSHTAVLEALRTQITDQEAKLNAYEQQMAEMGLVTAENSQIKEQLLTLEHNVKNLKELLENEKRRSTSLQSDRRRTSELEVDMKKLSESRDQALSDLNKEKATCKNLKSQIGQLEEQHRVRTEDLQQKLSKSSAAIQHLEQEIEALKKDMGKWKDKAQSSSKAEEHIEKLKKDHQEICRQLEKERLKVSEMEGQMKTELSAQLSRVSDLESELSAARSRLEEKNTREQKLLQTIQSMEDKHRNSKKEDAAHISQLEKQFNNSVQELSGLKLQKSELEATLQQLEEQKSRRVASMESDLHDLQKTVKERDCQMETLLMEVDRLKKQLEESDRSRQQELVQKDSVVCRLLEEKEKVTTDLKIERTSKMEVEAQLQKLIDVHKGEFTTLHNELSRSLDLIALKESELERLSKERAVSQEEFRQAKQAADRLSEEVAALKGFRDRASAQEEQLKRYVETVKATDLEVLALKETIGKKEKEVQRLEQDIKISAKDHTSVTEQHQMAVSEVKVLKSKITELQKRCSEQEDAISCARREATDARTMASEKALASVEQQRGLEALTAEIQQQRAKTSELTKQLDESRSLLSQRESSSEALKKELFHKVQELEQSQKSLSDLNRERSGAVAAAREQEKLLAKAKEQLGRDRDELDKKTVKLDTMQEELKNLTTKLTSNEHRSVEVKGLLEKEENKSAALEKQLKVVQEKLNSSAKEIIEKQSTVESLKAEASNYKAEADKQRVAIDGQQKKLSSQEDFIATLQQDIKNWQENCSRKEKEMSVVQEQLSSNKSVLREMEALKSQYQEIKSEQAERETKHKEELVKNHRAAETIQAELEKTKAEVVSLLPLKELLSQKEKTMEALEKEKSDHLKQIAVFQENKKQLLGEIQSMSQASVAGTKKMEMELSQVSEKHLKELESLRQQYEKKLSEGKEQLHDLSQKLEAVTSKYDHAKTRVLDERKKLQEEKQQLLAQVERLETAKKDQSQQVQELNKQLNQQEKTIKTQQQKLKHDSDSQQELEKKKKQVSELEAQLEQQKQAVEHYRSQIEKAKLHYDAKKQQNQELSDDLHSSQRDQEKLCKENAELKTESERLNKELQLSLLQSKEAEQKCKTLSNQVRSLEAQVEHADRQLRELGKFQVATDPMKSRETTFPPRITRSHADVSIDSLDMSEEEEEPMNSTRKNGRSQQEPSSSGGQASSPELQASNRLPRKVESLESLYFTPIPTRAQSKLDSSMGSIGDLSLDSSKKTRSARRRTTQIINITLTKKTKEEVETEPESANTSFYSLRSAPSRQSLHHQQPNARRGGRPQAAVSAPALTSLPSQESLVKPEQTSSDDSLNNSVLMNLPGYRPTRRSSARLSQAGGRNSFYVSTCLDEPDPQDDWNRIAELQQRNRACPPHLKTCYPLESRPSLLTSTVTDEEVKTGDPKETLRRATLLPSQIQDSLVNTRRMTLSSTGIEHSWGSSSSGITTRQQMKRVSEEPHHGPDTPESKKSASCFPRPMTPKGRPETRKMAAAESKTRLEPQPTNSSRKQAMSFNILNTPKKLGGNLLKRGLNRKMTPKTIAQSRGSSSSTIKSPHLSIRKSPSRRSPRGPPTKSPKITSKFFERKSRNK